MFDTVIEWTLMLVVVPLCLAFIVGVCLLVFWMVELVVWEFSTLGQRHKKRRIRL